ncbi:MAG: NAD-dependent epimerase/dehydratase family protein [Microthrixaceae bacterium]
MRVLVTGGAGFIGCHIVELLLERDHEVVVIDSLDPAAHDGAPDDLPGAAEWRWADVARPDTWDGVLDGVDAVCHQAAKVGLGVDLTDAPSYVTNNDLGTAQMLAAMSAQGWSGRIVLASSMVVYGEGRYRCAGHGVVRPLPRERAHLEVGRWEPRCPRCGEDLQVALVPEDAPLDPRNVYATTKATQEQLCAAASAELGVSTTALRYHNVYGPRMPRDTPYAGVASIFRSQLEAGESPRVFEDGGQRRDFVHVTDVARANVAALERPEPYHGPLNVASGQPITLLEMATTMAAEDGRGLAPEVVGGFRVGDVRHVTADAARAVEVLGVRAEVTPAEGLARFVHDPLRRPPKA